jgi:hypothetical protein
MVAEDLPPLDALGRDGKTADAKQLREGQQSRLPKMSSACNLASPK